MFLCFLLLHRNFRCAKVFSLFLLLRRNFHCSKVFRRFLQLRLVSHYIEFFATDLFAAQNFLSLPFLVHHAKVTIRIRCVDRLLQYIVARLKLTHTNIIATSQSKIKNARSGKVVRFEPHDLNLINVDPTIRVSFEQTICIRFYEKIQGYNVELTKKFSLNFTRVGATIARITFQVTKETMSVVTEIPMHG
jgi:hypothetical protein